MPAQVQFESYAGSRTTPSRVEDKPDLRAETFAKTDGFAGLATERNSGTRQDDNIFKPFEIAPTLALAATVTQACKKKHMSLSRKGGPGLPFHGQRARARVRER